MAGNCTGVSHADWKEGTLTHSTSSTARRADIKSASEAAVNECAKSAPRDNCTLPAAVCSDRSSQAGELESK